MDDEQEFDYKMIYGGNEYIVDGGEFRKFQGWDGSPIRVDVDAGGGSYRHVFVTAGVPLDFYVSPKGSGKGKAQERRGVIL